MKSNSISGQTHHDLRVGGDFTLSKAWLFSVTAMSTGGLVAPSTDDGSMWFTGFYCLIGVPVYGALLGAIGGHLSSQYQEAIKDASLRRFTDGDRDVLVKSGMHRDIVDWGDFLQVGFEPHAHLSRPNFILFCNALTFPLCPSQPRLYLAHFFADFVYIARADYDCQAWSSWLGGY